MEPENTLRSFKKALELKVDMVEFDVYVCKTGELVVIHDDLVERTTNGNGKVVEMTFQELRALDAGSGEKIPTLEEVLDLIDHKVQVNIELKGLNTAEPVAEAIRNYVSEKGWSYNDFLVSSFNHQELRKFQLLLPAVKIGVLTANSSVNLSELAEQFDAYSINLRLKSVNQEFIKEAHKLGLKVFVYTVDKKEDIKRMKHWKLDGIFTNFPDRI